MPVLQGTLDNGEGLVRGDAFPLRRYVKVPPGETIAEAWLGVKAAYSDGDGSATFLKTITETDNPGQGWVETDGAGGVASLRFDITSTNTLATTAGTRYLYDIQVRYDSGGPLTVERGTATWAEQVVQDS